MEPQDFVEFLRRERASAILRCADQETAARAMEAAIAGGFRVVEFTLTVPGVLDLIGDFSRRFREQGVVVGAGTVLTEAEVEAAVTQGARFLVSPVVDTGVIAAAQRLGVAMMPGTHTPTEMLAAHRAGAPLQKLFPVPGAGPAYVRACLGPLPFLKIVPTHGVDADNATQWLDAGAWAVGFVATLFDATDLAAGRFDRIEERAGKILARVRAWRAGEAG
jgi:2-dehydro-3-deoxyphosphogluconate aldolase / (4S)-4-hydroxy-2-oxoglutarate aldolase